MKRLALGLAFLIASIASASAACVPPAVMKDNASTTFNMSMVTAADGNCASSLTIQSGGVASGSFSSGAFASGAYAAGSIGSGAIVDLGAIADAASSSGGTGSLSAKLRLMTTQLNTINTTLGTPMQATGGSVTANAGTNLNTSALSLAATQGTTTDAPATAPASATAATEIALLKALLNVGQYPSGATAITASATGTTAATTATLASAVSKTTYICSLSIRANATAAATGNATVTGTITGTMNYTQWTAPLASGVGVVEQIFNPCVPGSATNTAIAVVSAAPGSGGTVSVSATGYQL